MPASIGHLNGQLKLLLRQFQICSALVIQINLLLCFFCLGLRSLLLLLPFDCARLNSVGNYIPQKRDISRICRSLAKKAFAIVSWLNRICDRMSEGIRTSQQPTHICKLLNTILTKIRARLIGVIY